MIGEGHYAGPDIEVHLTVRSRSLGANTAMSAQAESDWLQPLLNKLARDVQQEMVRALRIAEPSDT